MMFGRPPDHALVTEDYVRSLGGTIERRALSRTGENESDRMKTRYDRRAKLEGDLVLFYNPSCKKGRCPKLQESWEGPYKIRIRINDVVT